MITSKDNSKIKAVSLLSSSAKRRKETGIFILEGTRLCAEALREDITVFEMFYTSSVAKSNSELIEDLKKQANFVSEVSEGVFSKISDTCSPQGILLTVSLKNLNTSIKSGKLIAFERVQDPANLGAAARTAEALGFSGIILSSSGADPYSPKSLRASMGALLRIPIIYTNDFYRTLTEYKEQGFTVSGTVVDKNATPINQVEFSQNEIAVIGNEASGMTEDAKKLCNRLLTIPMAGRAESLNAAAAAGIVMWEMCR